MLPSVVLKRQDSCFHVLCFPWSPFDCQPSVSFEGGCSGELDLKLESYISGGLDDVEFKNWKQTVREVRIL
jgi:hypothetical protein